METPGLPTGLGGTQSTQGAFETALSHQTGSSDRSVKPFSTNEPTPKSFQPPIVYSSVNESKSGKGLRTSDSERMTYFKQFINDMLELHQTETMKKELDPLVRLNTEIINKKRVKTSLFKDTLDEL